MQNQMRAAVPAQPSVQFMKFQISLLEETQRANTHLRATKSRKRTGTRIGICTFFEEPRTH